LSNIPIINSAGQPVVQVVVGSTAQPSDGVVAANIAAVIGNLAFTSTPVTATVSGTSGVSCVVTTPTCSITNQEVYLGEAGTTSVASGSYAIQALVGSVLNQAIILGSPLQTKALQPAGQYAFPRNNQIDTSPAASPYYVSSWVPTLTTPSAASNGGGFTASSFTDANNDNLVQITSAQLPTLLSNSGSYGESESLWLTGFPVYDQQTSPAVQNFAILSAGGAYQVTFNKPIHEPYYIASGLSLGGTSGSATTGNSINNAGFSLLGQNWTIVNYGLPSGTVSTTSTVAGGKLSLATSLVPISTVYVGHNLTSSGFTVQLTDLGQANAQGVSDASIAVYYNNVLTNTTSVAPQSTTKFNVSGHSLYVHVNTTFAGLYAYQKWAKMQLYSNVYNLTNNQVFNQTNDPGWKAELLWTNTSGSTTPTDLQSIIVYNTTPVNLAPGQSYNFITNPKAYKVTFVGDTLSSSSYDGVTIQPQFVSSVQYQNVGGTASITNVTEPGQELVVTSSIPNAFSYGGQTSSTVTYLLGSQTLTVSNTLADASLAHPALGSPINVKVSGADAHADAYVSATNPLSVQVTGYQTSTSTGTETVSYPITSVTDGGVSAGISTQNFYNVTQIQVTGGTIPGLTVTATTTDAGADTIGTLSYNAAPEELYTQSGQSYYDLASSSVIYNQQNGQPTTTFTLSSAYVPGSKIDQYYTMSIPEYNVPGSTTDSDAISFAVTNALSGSPVSSPFQLNTTSGTLLNVTYTPTTGSSFNVEQGFVTERGSKVASIAPSEISLNLAKSVDHLELVVGPAAGTTTTTSKGTVDGPYGIGQSTNLANVTIANVTAKCGFSTTSCSVSGLSNVTATPSVTSAVTPVSLNTATTPLVVLDSNANSASTLIVVGSKYVNTVAAQIFAQNPTLDSSFGPSSVIEQAEGSNRILVAGYTADQTVTAGNQFIQALLSSASS
jgi:hypothetical protein